MMVDIVMERLPKFVSPGDIVGAIANEVKIDGSKIGKIRINKKRGRALVQINKDVVEKVLKVMNKRQIYGSDIRVSLKDYKELQWKYINKYKNLIYLERQEEMVKNRQEMRHMSGEERQDQGHALLELRGRAAAFPCYDFYQVRFILQDGEDELPNHRFREGDLVIISKGDPLDNGSTQGKVVKVTSTSIKVQFKGEPPYYVYSRGLRMDLYIHDKDFHLCFKTLKYMNKPNLFNPQLKNILLGEEEPEVIEEQVEINSSHLDEDQCEALSKAMQAKDLLLVQGGAGTGKTTLAVEILRGHLDKGAKVLAVGSSIASRDTLAEKLNNAGLKPLILENIDIKEEPEYEEIDLILESVDQLIAKRDELTHPGGQWVQGMDYNEIIEKAKEGKRYSGIPGYRLEEMAEWIQLQRDIDNKLKRASFIEEEIYKKYFEEHDVICITHQETDELKENFDLVIIDDAHMLTEPETLPAYFKGDKIILLGDKGQIPPQVVNEEAKMGGLRNSLFNRFYNELDDQWISILKTQHRFNFSLWNTIQELCPVGTTLNVKEDPLEVNLNPWRTGIASKVLEESSSLVLLDTSSVDVNEEELEEEYINELEADLVREILQMGLDLEDTSDNVGILTLYQKQVEEIEKALEINDIEFDCIYTVDDFCGCEKDLIILSLVNSGLNYNWGKAKSVPHLVTALTRARKKCILIGDFKNLTSHSFYQNLLGQIEERGKVYTL